MGFKRNSIAALIAACIALLLLTGAAAGADEGFIILNPDNGGIDQVMYWELDSDGKAQEPTFIPQIPNGYRSFSGWYLQGSPDPFNFNTGTLNSGDMLWANYSVNYVVLFKDGDGIVIDSYSLAPDKQLYASNVQPTTTTSGYTFKHWYLSGADENTAFSFPTQVSDSHAVSGTITFLPKFSNECTVVFLSDGTQVAPKTVTVGGTITAPEQPTRTGYNFVRWVYDGNNTSFNFNSPVTESTVLRAVWSGKTVNYTVLYWLEDPNSPGTYNSLKTETKTATAGTTVDSLNPGTLGGTVAHANYANYNASSDIILGTGGTVINLYYNLIEYTIQFDLTPSFSSDYNTSGLTTSTMKVKGVTYSQTYNNATKLTTGDMYSFKAKVGQNINGMWPNTSLEYSRNGTIYTDFASWSRTGQSVNYVSNRPILSSEMVDAGSTTVTYPANWGSSTNPHVVQYYLESLLHETKDTTYNSKNYTQSSLYTETYRSNTNSLQAKQISGMTAINPASQTTEPKVFYYDRFVRDVVYDLGDGGSFPAGSLPAVSGYTQTANSYKNVKWGEYLSHFEPKNDPTKNIDGIDYIFQGWTYDAEGNRPVNFATDTVLEPTQETGDNLVIYAQWRSSQFTVTFYENTGSTNIIAKQTGGMGDSIDFSAPGLFQKGATYTQGLFKGWFWFVSGNLTSYAQDTPITGHTDLYGQWQTGGFAITYDGMGNTNSSATVPTDSNRYDLGVNVTLKPGNGLEKSGNLVFIGWMVKDDETNKLYRPGDALTVTGNMELEAQYANRNDLVKLTYIANKNNVKDVSFYVARTEINLALKDLFSVEDDYVEHWVAEDNQEYQCGAAYNVGSLSNSVSELNFTASWKGTEYTVSFAAGQNGYLHNGTVNQVVTFPGIPANTLWTSAGITVPTPVAHDGHYFVEWTKSGATADPVNNTHAITDHESYTAMFAVVTEVNVTFYAQPGNFTGGDDKYNTTANVSELIEDVPEFASKPLGYEFGGWYTALQPLGGPLAAADEWDLDTRVVEGASDVHLHAGWISMANVTVTFDAQGGLPAPESQELLYGDVVVQPASPVKAGYDFASWQLDGVNYDFSSPVVASITLNATYTQNNAEYTVTFNADGGSPEPAAQTVAHNGKVVQPQKPVKEGYRFIHWYDTTGSEDNAWNFNAGVISDMTLKAKWVETATYTLTYYQNADASDDVNESFEYNSGDFVKILAAEDTSFAKEDHILIGWSDSASGNVLYNQGQWITMPYEDLDLYAVWSDDVNKYYINYFPNGADNVYGDDPVKIYYEDKTEVLIAGYEETGFISMYDEVTAWSNLSSNKLYAAGETYDMSGEGAYTDLHAEWSELVTVIFDANGGEFSTGRDTYKVVARTGQPIPELDVTVSKGSEILVGWSTSREDEGILWKLGNDGYELNGIADLYLYAIWSGSDMAVVTFDAGDGEVYVDGFGHMKTVDVVVPIGERVSQPHPISSASSVDVYYVAPAGKILSAWYLDNVAWNFNNDVNGNMTLLAIWKNSSGGGISTMSAVVVMPEEEVVEEVLEELPGNATGNNTPVTSFEGDIEETPTFSWIWIVVLALLLLMVVGFGLYRFGINKQNRY